VALIKFGGGITAMSGSIAGNTFARNRFGYYSRARSKPVNPRSSSQVKMRTITSYLAETWHEVLTQTERDRWETYAQAINMKNRLGETVKLTGFQHFIRSNSVTMQRSKAIVKPGPTTLTLPEKDVTFAIAANAGSQHIGITFDNTLPWATQTDGFLAFYQGRPQGATRNFFNGPWHYLGGLDGDDPAPESPVQKTAYYPLVAGQRIWVYCRIHMADGRLSERFSDDCIVE
jgi:hypothetical protein